MRNFLNFLFRILFTTFLFCTGLFCFHTTGVHAGEVSLHAVYVGRGDALIISSNQHYMIIDSGTKEGAPLLIKYLKSLNIPENKIDYVVSTHPDGDHVGGFPSVLSKYQVGQVLYSPCTKSKDSYYKFINSLKEKNIPFKNPVEGESLQLGDATISVLYDGSKGSTYNECSIVLKVSCDGKSMLLMGDLPSSIERTLIEQGYDLKSDILKIGHHGAAASSCADFLDAVGPSHAVISSARTGTPLPKPKVLMRLARRFIKTYRTTDGNVKISIRDGKIITDNRENNPYQSIKNGNIVLSNNVFFATGKEIRPVATLFVNGIKVPANHYRVSYSNNVFTGFGTVTLSATNQKYVSSCKTTFMILPQSITLKGSAKSNHKIKLSWTAQNDATGYILKYSTDKSFQRDVTYMICSASDKPIKKIKKLKSDTNYYFQIRAYKSNIGNGKWSAPICVKTKKLSKSSQDKRTATTAVLLLSNLLR